MNLRSFSTSDLYFATGRTTDITKASKIVQLGGDRRVIIDLVTKYAVR